MGEDLAVIIPTKDRPEKIRNLLETISVQTLRCGRIIIIDGGKSVRDIVSGFEDRLPPVDYRPCVPPGQIRQRNMGIALLDERTSLVCFLDDDIELDSQTFEKAIHCWNHVENETAGIGFNIINMAPHKHSLLRGLMLSSSPIPGQILSSGVNVPFHNIQSDIRTQFLGGGYTIWKQTILNEFPQENLNTRWAWGEDVRYSYPIGVKYPLYVCADAKARHEHVYDQAPPTYVHRYQGCKGALAIFYFVSSHSELSRMACLWMLFASMMANFAVGTLTLNSVFVKFAIGRAEGIFTCLKAILGFTDLRKEMED